jgi:hypothetical protein
MLQPTCPSTHTQSLSTTTLMHSSCSFPFDFNDIYEITSNLDVKTFMISSLPSTQPFKTSQQSTKSCQYLSTKYQDMDFTQPKHNFFAQALVLNVGDPASIVVVLSTHDATQWQVVLDIEYIWYLIIHGGYKI